MAEKSVEFLDVNSLLQLPPIYQARICLTSLAVAPPTLRVVFYSPKGHPLSEGRGGQSGQLRRTDLGANRKAGCPSGLAPFDHPTTTRAKKTLFQAIAWRLEQGQQVFFKYGFLMGRSEAARWPAARPKPGSSAGSQSRRKSRLLTCPATSLCIEGTTCE